MKIVPRQLKVTLDAVMQDFVFFYAAVLCGVEK
ncbi:hypothetical protein PSTH1771_14755 [Pseudomonas syringae pv. theae]|uniref:Uncharacterized protein n=5 Tax=Pseudomonas syringae group TaxID=136849 RepID=A0A3M4RL50_9PSED|nr:hypothetical protein PSYMP_20634 [Pseudomonas amygdali pv. morsprunorum str. M302280]RML43049.1 hypothetical protein ALQ95_102135 [Pseudomonas syringae pv. ribicola]RML49561.1 hypothetical protein ALQ94_102003 [Pseudomonas amygdali pv. morsprunorum]RMO68301.1 hypothetical protein ALQ36_102999 [Pseudomonas syringae pv. primulae]RMQ29539.1 hypothetical protein ALQ07_102446 [Pseudomonas syringae pv. actinidiae]RMT64373.1 hypothetical protein ALP44_102322 [Pseudomonas syringae pv. theae]